jgi:hypothetical protein
MRYFIALPLLLLLAACNSSVPPEQAERMQETVTTAPPPPASVEAPPPREMSRAPAAVGGALPAAPVDQVLEQLSKANLAFVMPGEANVKSKIRAQLLISFDLLAEDLARELRIEGEEFTGEVLVSRVVLAKLTAPAFTVDPITPERQAVSQTATTEWLWHLTPTATGTHEVFLTITAFVYVDEDNFVERHIRTFEKVIIVEVEPQQVLLDWLAQYWQWLFTTLLIPLFLYLRKRYKK